MKITLNTGREIGNGCPAYLIAEIGSNHDGSLSKAKELIRLAKEAGACAVKFQSFRPETLVHRSHAAWKVLEKLSLPEEWHQELLETAKERGIDFISSPFDPERLALLNLLDVPAIKIASGDLTYHELLRMAGELKKPLLLATGHATMQEVEQALDVLWKAGQKDIVLMHCASLYPTRFEEANIRAMVTLREKFETLVGYSDHSPGSVVPLGAVALGASVIEKHFSDNPALSGPDHGHSLSPDAFAQMYEDVRRLELAMGDGVKAPQPREEAERVEARRALYATAAISMGTELERGMVKLVRVAGEGCIPADRLNDVLGKAVKADIEPDEMLTWRHFQS